MYCLLNWIFHLSITVASSAGLIFHDQINRLLLVEDYFISVFLPVSNNIDLREVHSPQSISFFLNLSETIVSKGLAAHNENLTELLIIRSWPGLYDNLILLNSQEWGSSYSILNSFSYSGTSYNLYYTDLIYAALWKVPMLHMRGTKVINNSKMKYHHNCHSKNFITS